LFAAPIRRDELSGGDDLVSSLRGFLYSGADSVICCQWSVHDAATRDLMLAFYEALLKGRKTRAEALRLARGEVPVTRIRTTGRYSASTACGV